MYACTHTYLETNKQRNGLHRVIPSVNIVPHEQVVCVGRLSSDAEQLHQVVELPVDIPTHRDGTLDLLDI